MAIPQAFLDVLNSLQILPLPRSQPGDLVKPQLNKDLASAFSPLQTGEILGQLDLNVAFNNLNLALLTGTSEMVLKQVQFSQPVTGVQASQLDVTEAANSKLPYVVPTAGTPPILTLGTMVEGFIGKIKADSSQAGSLAGSLIGKVSGDLKKAAALTSLTPPTINWRIQDERGNTLISGTDFVADTTKTLTTAAPVFALMPVFVEMSNAATTLVGKRFLFCDLTFTDINGALNPPFIFTIGPAPLEVVEAQVPMIAALTENPLGATPATPMAGFPGLTMVAVPSSAALKSLTALSGPLSTLRSILTTVSSLTTVAGFTLSAADSSLVGVFGASAGLIGALITAIGSVIDPGAFVVADQIMGLNNVEAAPSGCGIFGWQACNMNDIVSTVILVAPPTRSVQCFNRFNLWTGTGQFTLTCGMEATAFAADLSVTPASGTATGTVVAATPATAAPAGLTLSTLTVNVPAQTGVPFHTATTFDNCISSMQFM